MPVSGLWAAERRGNVAEAQESGGGTAEISPAAQLCPAAPGIASKHFSSPTAALEKGTFLPAPSATFPSTEGEISIFLSHTSRMFTWIDAHYTYTAMLAFSTS